MNEESRFKKLRVVVSIQGLSAQEWPENKVDGLTLQIGYPDSKGVIQWKSASRFRDKNNELSRVPALVSWNEAIIDRAYIFDFTYQNQLDSSQQHIHTKVTLPFTRAKEVHNGEEIIRQTIGVHSQPQGEASIGGPLVLKWMIVPVQ